MKKSMMRNMKRDRGRITDIQAAVKVADVNNDEILDFDEWRAQLQSMITMQIMMIMMVKMIRMSVIIYSR